MIPSLKGLNGLTSENHISRLLMSHQVQRERGMKFTAIVKDGDVIKQFFYIKTFSSVVNFPVKFPFKST